MKHELFQLPSKVIDLELGIELTGSERFTRELLHTLIGSLPYDLAELRKAYEQQNWHAIQMIVLHIRENARFCGAPRLSQACINFHKYLASGEIELRDGLYFQLLEETDAVRNAHF
jgi:HPt (histidine-containing phosphotransfer) domain-containing protein